MKTSLNYTLYGEVTGCTVTRRMGLGYDTQNTQLKYG